MSHNSQNIINQCMKNVFLSMEEQHRIALEDSGKLPRFDVYMGLGLNKKYEIMSCINESLPRFMSKEEVFDILGGIDHEYEEDEHGEFTPHMNDYILNAEHKLRQCTFECKCDYCLEREEDYTFWLFDTIDVRIDESYEFHGRVIGAHNQREFRLKYQTNVVEDCNMYTVSNEFAELLNDLHVKLNHRFITKYEFLRPMDKIREQMEKMEYNADQIIIHLYTFIERVYGKDYAEYDNICLTFFQNISVEEYIRRTGNTPYGEYNNFKGRDYSQYFDDNDNITDRANELCFSTEQLYPEDADEPEHRLSDYLTESAYESITMYAQNRKKVLTDNLFEFESLYGTDPLTLEGPASVENGVNGVLDDFDYTAHDLGLDDESDGSDGSTECDDSEDMSDE